MSSQYELMEVDEPSTRGNGLNGRKLTRGEKSKIAAKSRRDKENIAYTDLVSELPLPNDVLNKMDKASVIRLAICYIKLKHFLQKDVLSSCCNDIPKENRPFLHSLKSSPAPEELELGETEKELHDVEGQMMLDALNGFLIFINKKYSIRFISASVTDHLGLTVENLIGKNVNEIIHPCDIAELAKHFTSDGSTDINTKRKAITDKSCTVSHEEDKSQKVFYLRMKHNMTRAGSKTKQTGYTLVQWSGKLKQHVSSKTNTLVTDGLVCICRPMQTSSVMEIRMDGNMFMSRHDLGMTFTFCDTRIVTLIGYEPNEVLGKTAYHFHNPIDAPKVSDCHHKLIIKGTSVSKYYRFLGKNDNWVWLQTRATIIYNTANKPQYIVCMNYVISEEEGERYLMLEEHKHANTPDDNVVVTLPDNHPHTVVINTELTKPAGPTIIELEDKNLKKTACLNGELDAPRSTPCNSSSSGQMSDSFSSGLVQGTRHPETSYFSSVRNNSSSKPGYPVASQGSLLLQQHFTAQPLGTSAGGSIEIIPVNTLGSSCTMSPNIINNEEKTANLLVGDTSTTLDSSFINLYPGSCHSNYSNSEDGGYESASSPASSHTSPQVVSPYSVNERVCGDVSYESAVMVTTDTNPAIIKNCNFGVGYPQSYDEMENTQIFDDDKGSIVPDAENILDELLQSFNQPSGNLDENMSVVFSTMESLSQHTFQTVTSNISYPNVTSEPQTSGLCREKMRKQPKLDKSVLRHILTIPEDKIPKQPVSLVQKDSNQSSRPPDVGQNVVFPKKHVGLKSVLQGDTSGERLINSMIQKTLAQKTHEEQLNAQAAIGQGQGQLELLPDDISDFALQYMETLGDDDSVTDLSELSSDILMDTTESELTKGFLEGLENQCNSSALNSSLHKSRPISQNGQIFGNCGQNGKLKGNNSSSTQQQAMNSGCYGNKISPSSNDRVYIQKVNGSHKQRENISICNSVYNNRNVLFSDSQTQTLNPSITEFQRHPQTVSPAQSTPSLGSKSPCGESSLLQKLLTGELSKDSYIQMELNRFPRQHGLKPN